MRQILKPYGVKAIHPDEFVQSLIELNLMVVCMAAQS